MLETDVLYAYVKKSDWLKSVATRLIADIENGKFGVVCASREVLHELYYVSIEEGLTLDGLISRLAALTAIENLEYLDTTYETDILALTLMKQYRLKSVFDGYYAATAASIVEDRTIISTDEVFDRIPAITRVDPRTL